MAWYIWMIAGLALCIAEIFTAGFFILLPGIAALLTGVLAIFVPSLPVQLAVFVALTAALIILLRPVILKSFNIGKHHLDSSNANGMIGKEALVTEDIDNAADTGYIKLYADRFPARTLDGSRIPKGERVVIRRIEGIRMFVEKAGG